MHNLDIDHDVKSQYPKNVSCTQIDLCTQWDVKMCRTGESQANTYMEVQESDLSKGKFEKAEPGNQVANQTVDVLHFYSNWGKLDSVQRFRNGCSKDFVCDPGVKTPPSPCRRRLVHCLDLRH